jgi:hypothetical protein
MVGWIEATSSVDVKNILIDRRSKKVAERCAAECDLRITKLLSDPEGLPDGKGKRTKLTRLKKQRLRSVLAEALEYAALFPGPLPNRRSGLGRPPDNAVLIFIDDIHRACRAADLKPGLRYIKPVGLPGRTHQRTPASCSSGGSATDRPSFENKPRKFSSLVRCIFF